MKTILKTCSLFCRSAHVFKVFGHEVHMYMCLEMAQQSDSVFQYYIRTGEAIFRRKGEINIKEKKN